MNNWKLEIEAYAVANLAVVALVAAVVDAEVAAVVVAVAVELFGELANAVAAIVVVVVVVVFVVGDEFVDDGDYCGAVAADDDAVAAAVDDVNSKIDHEVAGGYDIRHVPSYVVEVHDHVAAYLIYLAPLVAADASYCGLDAHYGHHPALANLVSYSSFRPNSDVAAVAEAGSNYAAAAVVVAAYVADY